MWISKEKYEDIERRVKELNEELQRLYNMAYLVDIKRASASACETTACNLSSIFAILYILNILWAFRIDEIVQMINRT